MNKESQYLYPKHMMGLGHSKYTAEEIALAKKEFENIDCLDDTDFFVDYDNDTMHESLNELFLETLQESDNYDEFIEVVNTELMEKLLDINPDKVFASVCSIADGIESYDYLMEHLIIIFYPLSKKIIDGRWSCIESGIKGNMSWTEEKNNDKQFYDRCVRYLKYVTDIHNNNKSN